MHLACTARVVLGHLLHREEGIEIGEPATAMLHRGGHAEESLLRELAQSLAVLHFGLDFERARGELAFCELRHHALDGHLLLSQLHAAVLACAVYRSIHRTRTQGTILA